MSAQDDELVRRYREASAQDDARPGAHVRNAVRAHAQMLAAAAATAAVPLPTPPAPGRAAANQSRWKITALATVAVVGLSGLLMLQFQRGTPEEQEIAYGQRPAEAPARAQPSAAPPSPAPATEAPSAAPEVSQGSARDEAGPSVRSMAQKPAEPAPGQARPLAKTAPALAIQEAKSSPAPSTAGAISGFPASPPLIVDQSLGARPAVPPAPSMSSGPPAEMRKRSAAQDVPAAREALSPYAAAPAAASVEAARPAAPAQTVPTPQAARGLQGGNAADNSLAAAAPRADHGRSTASPDDLREAARAGHTLQVENLIHQGAAIDARDSTGRTALMLAAVNGQTTTVQKLLALGANPALVDREGLNAAQQARRQGYTRIADLIDTAQ